MRCLIALLLILGSTTARSQERRAAKPRMASRMSQITTAEGTISVSFVQLSDGANVSATSAGQGSLRMGRVSAATGSRTPGVTVERRQNSIVARTYVGLKLDSPGTPQGSASLSAFLFFPEARCDIFLNGVRLGTASRLIQGSVRYGEVGRHRVEIEIPMSLPDTQGDISNTIGFLAVAN